MKGKKKVKKNFIQPAQTLVKVESSKHLVLKFCLSSVIQVQNYRTSDNFNNYRNHLFLFPQE